jgi:hypothetical protein
MKRLLCLVLAVVLAAVLPGCGSDREKGINKDKDKPREAPAEGK